MPCNQGVFMDIALVTYNGLPDLDPDDGLFRDELVKRGHKVQACIWDDASIDWSKFDVAIMRSAWDYHLKKEQFYAWMESVSKQTKLFNSAEVMKWSSHKSYLKQLAAAGLPIVETLWIEKGSSANGVFDSLNWQKTIVKPAVGLATFGVKRFPLDDSQDGKQANVRAAEQHANHLALTEDVMIQPYLSSVENYGERALIFLNGKYSHTIRKSSFQHLAPGGQAGETSVPRDDLEVVAAQKVIDYLSHTPLYARVDLVRDLENTPVILELELVEPSLFLSFHPPAVLAFADAFESVLQLSI